MDADDLTDVSCVYDTPLTSHNLIHRSVAINGKEKVQKFGYIFRHLFPVCYRTTSLDLDIYGELS